jgi:hypothetical protein
LIDKVKKSIKGVRYHGKRIWEVREGERERERKGQLLKEDDEKTAGEAQDFSL